MTIVFRDGFSSFVPRARLIKLLGGELIRDEVMAVAELVKNAHDADATVVKLTFNGTSSPEGEIIIEDDGCGMSVDVLLQHWMQPAGSSKSKRGFHYTASGRRMLGEKGVGRFAVDRLGRHVELVSRAKGSDTEIVVTFDWDQFDDETLLLSDVGVKWREQSAQTLERPGTRIRISSLRMPWKERTFRRLCTRLQRLLSPVVSDTGFRVEINSDEFPDYQGPLQISFLDRATYRIQAEFDGHDRIIGQIGNQKAIRHRWDGSGSLSCGPVRVTIHCYDLEPEALAKVGPPQDVRAWLREWSGISIYRDGFRVLPYGEPDDDWLRLDQRRVNNPVVRLSNNQVCGFVEIGRDANPELRDQTNRGGLLQNRAYDDLRKLVLFVLQIVEAERQAIRNPPLKASQDISAATERTDTDVILSELKGAVGKSRAGQTSLRSLVERLEQNLEKERSMRDREIERYLEMAAIGHGAGVASHALTPRLKQLRRLLRPGHRSQESSPTSSLFLSEKILDELEQTAHFLSTIAPSRRAASRTIDVGAQLLDFESSVASLLASHDVRMRTFVPEDVLVRAEIPLADFHQVLHILLWNSLDWIGKQDRKLIDVRVKASDPDFCRIHFRDTGSGVPPELADQIFEPGFSRKPNGRGMGLAVARRLLANSGGTIVLKPSTGSSRGTTFELKLRLKRSRTTPH